jgi:hypothetical protein
MATEKPFLPKDFLDKANEFLSKRYSPYLQPGEIIRIESGKAESDAWTIKIVFETADRSLHLPLEIAARRVDMPNTEADEARDLLLDFAAHFYDRYFRGGRTETLPLDWLPFPVEDQTVYARGWERNMRLEEAADRFLAGEQVDDLLTPLEKSRRSG